MIKLSHTNDGSNTLVHTELEEPYHSIHGAIQESKHVFIENGLLPLLQLEKPKIAILEIGLGTGLNALLTLLETQKHPIQIYYEALEPFPVQLSIAKQLNYPTILNADTEFNAIHTSKWNELQQLATHFYINKRKVMIQDAEVKSKGFDLVYFDAFAPSKQPEVWQYEQLTKVVEGMKYKGILVTYCAKGQLKRDLISLGLDVEKLPGPPGKREIIRATKQVESVKQKHEQIIAARICIWVFILLRIRNA